MDVDELCDVGREEFPVVPEGAEADVLQRVDAVLEQLGAEWTFAPKYSEIRIIFS